LLTLAGATSSTDYSTDYAAARAIDASATTRWSSAFFDPQWLSVDLGGVRRIRRVVLSWEDAASGDYDIQVADAAAGPWVSVYTDSNGNGGVDDIDDLNVNGRYVRMYSRARTTAYGNSLFDVRVYGDLNASCGTTTWACGNGVLEPGEECDDGNTVNNDTCSNQCAQATCDDRGTPVCVPSIDQCCRGLPRRRRGELPRHALAGG
jgi:cysteine-rich repeat protein